MRNMSFAATVEAVRNRTKTVTRRTGWANLKPGELFCAVEKCRGLKKGEKVKRLAVLRCISNTRRGLCDVTTEDVAREGFPGSSTVFFCLLFLRLNPGFSSADQFNRIEFEYVEPPRQ